MLRVMYNRLDLPFDVKVNEYYPGTHWAELDPSFGPKLIQHIPLTFRIGSFPEPESGEYSGFAPSKRVPKLDTYLDRCSYYDRITHFMSDWQFMPDEPPPDGEHEIFHVSPRGEVRMSSSDPWVVLNYPSCDTAIVTQDSRQNYFLHGTGPQYTHGILRYPTTQEGLKALAAKFRDRGPLYVAPITGYDGYSINPYFFRYRVLKDLIEVWSATHQVHYINGVPHDSTCIIARSAFRLIMKTGWPLDTEIPDDDIFTVEYQFSVDWVDPWIVTSDTSPHLHDSFVSSRYRESYTLPDWGSWHYSIARDVKCEIRPDLGFTIEKFLGYNQTPLELYSRRPFVESASDYSLAHFRDVTASLAPDAVACAGIVANDALADAIASFGINQLENSQGLSSLFGLVDVKALFSKARDISQGKRTLLTALDLLAESRLVYSYALAPTANDIATIRNGAAAFRHRWLTSGDFSEAPMYGAREFTVPDEICGPFTGLKMSMHVKVVGKFHADSLLAACLPADSVGLLPRLSSLWALIPFSFVIDNVVNVNNSLEFVESQVLRSAVYETKYAVVSWTFEWEPGPSLLAEASGLPSTVFVQSDLEYRAFTRVVLPRQPFVGPSRILKPLLASHMPKDLMTYGALTYTLLT